MKKNNIEHLAMILDGNGRWATSQNKNRNYGHNIGLEKIQDAAKGALRHKIKFLTLFVFSTENWKRPKEEVKYLWEFPEKHFSKFLDEYLKNDVKVLLIGNRDKIPKKALKIFDDAVEKTKNCKSLTINFAMNYGSRDEIIRAINNATKKNKTITEKILNQYLDTSNMPDVDLLVRTSGEQRISNFLLWQIAYAEIMFVKFNWPELDDKKFDEIIEKYHLRSRTYGGLKNDK